MTDSERLSILLGRYVQKTASGEEEKELYRLLSAVENKKALGDLIEEYYEQLPQSFTLSEVQSAAILSEVLKKQAPVVPMIQKKKWRLWVAAAAVIILLAGGWWLLERSAGRKPVQTEIAKTKDDIPSPKESRAVITLANGGKIYLDSAASGVIGSQQGANLIKSKSGEVAYQATGVSATPEYNTLFNPRGSRVIPLTLVDGTKVWLNSESSIRYPTLFNGQERRVEITGEAYFEVAHDATKPFIVSKGATTVQVLGTHFNVNVYDDEDAIRITLLEGLVKVSGNNKSVTIKPGQQASVANDIKVIDGADLDQVMAWKNDRFVFSGDNIQSIMRQLARWYDVEVRYEGAVPSDEFVGVITRSRNESISSILNTLSETGTVHFEIHGKTITIKK